MDWKCQRSLFNGNAIDDEKRYELQSLADSASFASWKREERRGILLFNASCPLVCTASLRTERRDLDATQRRSSGKCTKKDMNSIYWSISRFFAAIPWLSLPLVCLQKSKISTGAPLAHLDFSLRSVVEG